MRFPKDYFGERIVVGPHGDCWMCQQRFDLGRKEKGFPGPAIVKRADAHCVAGEKQPLTMVVELPGAPLRWGIAWRLDDAEPGTIVLTYVVPGSPAANAGLRAGDRVYQVGGRDFADEATFIQWAKVLPGPLPLLVEHDGRLRTVVIQLQQSEPVKRAA